MKPTFALICMSFFFTSSNAQTAITAVNTSPVTVATGSSYTDGGNTYNWGIAPNNTMLVMDGFSAGGANYQYASLLSGNVKLRRVDNAKISGNFTLVWSEAKLSGSTFNLFTEYQNEMETIFADRVYNRGTDNLFDNTSENANNIERLDYILSSAYSNSEPEKVGFAVFERGAAGAHDAFIIAAITAVDGSGDPSAYGNIIRVKAANYGDPGPNVTCRVLKAEYPNNLLDASSSTLTQSRGGVFISLDDLGIAADQDVYGYSLFADDLPAAATPADLVDYTDATFFPNNTGDQGGIDLVGITGMFIQQDVAPTRFVQFSAVESNDKVQLKWTTENESSVDNYEVERSEDGQTFNTIAKVSKAGSSNGNNTYYYEDNLSGVASSEVFYRIKQYDHDRSFYYTRVISVKRSINNAAIRLYPNPVQDVLNMSLVNSGSSQVKVSIINSTGTLVRSEAASLSNGNNYLTITGMDRLPSGIYYLSVKWADGKTVNKHFLKK